MHYKNNFYKLIYAMRTAINSAIINDKKEILLVRKHDTWILPWGKPEIWESDVECLHREVWEELNGAKLKNLQFFDNFIWQTPHKWDLLEARVYFAELVVDVLKATAELSDAKYIKDFDNYSISEITNNILDWLKKTWYL